MFAKLSYAMNSIASKMMSISSAPQNKLAWYYEVDGQDVLTGKNSFWKTLLIILRHAVFSVAEYVWEMVVRAIYAVAKWVLTIIDFIFIFIREIIGLNTEISSLEDISKSDVIFQFIFNQNVIRIIRNLILFSIVLLIIFSIIAIFMSEYKYVTQGGDNSKKNVLVNALRSLFLMAFVPLVVIGGIVMSNAILKALYIASAGGQDTTLSNQIFVASSYQSNSYRRYAYENKKIPITYNFSEISGSDNVAGYGSTEGLSGLEDAFNAFMSDSVWLRGFKTFWMFYADGFLDMQEIDKLDQIYESNGTISPYHIVYDMGMQSRTEQYFIMADVMDWAMKGANVFYFKTAEEIYETFEKTKNSVGEAKMPGYMPIYVDGNDYKFDVWYYGDENAVTYTHTGGADNKDKINGAQDEAKGAKFLIAIEKTVVGNDNKTYTYYYPLLSASENFATDYYAKSNQLVVAKGLFDEGKYPTAIKIEDGMVKFYRDDLNVPTLVDLFPHISYEKPEGVTENLGSAILGWGFKTITGVDIHEFIPYLYYNVDIFNLFTKTSRSIAKLDNGMMKLNYNFTQRTFAMANVYYIPAFNVIILLFACGLLLGILIRILFGVVMRVLDITLLFITYPAVLATMPLDSGTRFKGWTDKFVKKVLSIYGVVIGINLILLLMPVITSIQLFTPADIRHAALLRVIPNVGAFFVNFIFQYLFIFVAFNSIEKFTKIIEGLATNWQKDKKDPDMEKSMKVGEIMRDGEMVVNDLKALPEKVSHVVTGQAAIDLVEKGIDAVKGFVPGMAFVDYRKKKSEDKLAKLGLKEERKDIWSDALGGRKGGSTVGGSGGPTGGTGTPGTGGPSGGTAGPGAAASSGASGVGAAATAAAAAAAGGASGGSGGAGAGVQVGGASEGADASSEAPGADGQTPITVPSGSSDERGEIAAGAGADGQTPITVPSGSSDERNETGEDAGAENSETEQAQGTEEESNADESSGDVDATPSQESETDKSAGAQQSAETQNVENPEKTSQDGQNKEEDKSYVNIGHRNVKPIDNAQEQQNKYLLMTGKKKVTKPELKTHVNKGFGKVKPNKEVKEVNKHRLFKRKPKKVDAYKKNIQEKKQNVKQKKTVLKNKKVVLKGKKKVAKEKKRKYNEKKWEHRSAKASVRAAKWQARFLVGEAKAAKKEEVRALKAEAKRIKQERKVEKQKFKDAKKDVKVAKKDVKIAKQDVKLAKSELKEAKVERKIAKGKIRDPRKILKHYNRKKKNIKSNKKMKKKRTRVNRKKEKVAMKKEQHQASYGDTGNSGESSSTDSGGSDDAE